MLNGKPWYASVGVWGSVATLVCPIIASLFHVSISDDDTRMVADYLSLSAEMVAGLVALYGRVRATRQITA